VVKFSAIENLVESIGNLRSEIEDVVRAFKDRLTVAVVVDPDHEEVRTEVRTNFLLEGMRAHEASLVAQLHQMGVELD
jgi:hypothetical protein